MLDPGAASARCPAITGYKWQIQVCVTSVHRTRGCMGDERSRQTSAWSARETRQPPGTNMGKTTRSSSTQLNVLTDQNSHLVRRHKMSYFLASVYAMGKCDRNAFRLLALLTLLWLRWLRWSEIQHNRMAIQKYIFFVVANELYSRDYIYLGASIILVKRDKLLLESRQFLCKAFIFFWVTPFVICIWKHFLRMTFQVIWYSVALLHIKSE